MSRKEFDKISTEYTIISVLTTDIIISIGHDLRTPLTSIKGFSQLMKNDSRLQTPTMITHYNDIIDKNSDRLHGAITNLINILEHNKKYIDEMTKNGKKNDNGS